MFSSRRDPEVPADIGPVDYCELHSPDFVFLLIAGDVIHFGNGGEQHLDKHRQEYELSPGLFLVFLKLQE